MAKLTFEEWKERKEYEAYLNAPEESEQPAPAPAPTPAPAPAPEEAPAPAEDYRAELAEIRAQLAVMAKALSPSLGDVQPVGIEDVVSRFFNENGGKK